MAACYGCAMAREPTDFRWDDLKLFLAAFRTRSLTQAAAALGLNQSTMSRRLSGFEEALGARLFDRTPEGLLPTDVAERLLEAAERAEAASHDVGRLGMGVDREVQGDVRIALADGIAFYLAAPRVAALYAEHPGLRLQLVVSTESADLSRREADVAVRFFRPPSGDLVAKRLYEGPYGIFAAPSLSDRLGAGRHALRELPFVAWDVTQGHYPEARWENEVGVTPIVRASSMMTRLALANAGVGAIQLTREFGHALDGLVELATEPIALRAEVWLVTHQALRDVPRIQAVWRWIESQLAAFPSPPPPP